MKRFLCSILMLLVLVMSLTVPAYAADESRSFSFDLSIDGGSEKAAVAGDVITVSFTLRRTDSAGDYPMYAMQNEILYDPAFFELVEGSTMTAPGIETRDLGLRDGGRAFYMNFVSLTGSDTWKAQTLVGSFQLKVVGTEGSSVIRSSSCFVATRDGQEHYASTQQDATVTLSGGCLIRFETNGGSQVPNQTVALGGKVKKPDDPTKEGYFLEGWYSDMDLQNRWDFSKDTVEGNMTLYAGWTADAPHHFNPLWLALLLVVLLMIFLILLGRRNARYRIVPIAAKRDKDEDEHSDTPKSEKEDKNE